jgi:hypothetical protein
MQGKYTVVTNKQPTVTDQQMSLLAAKDQPITILPVPSDEWELQPVSRPVLMATERAEPNMRGYDCLTAIIISANDDNMDDLVEALSSTPFED